MGSSVCDDMFWPSIIVLVIREERNGKGNSRRRFPNGKLKRAGGNAPNRPQNPKRGKEKGSSHGQPLFGRQTRGTRGPVAVRCRNWEKADCSRKEKGKEESIIRHALETGDKRE